MTRPRAAGVVAAASATPMATPAVPLTTPKTATSVRSGTLSLTCGNNAVATDPARTPPTAYGADRWVRSISHPAVGSVRCRRRPRGIGRDSVRSRPLGAIHQPSGRDTRGGVRDAQNQEDESDGRWIAPSG